MTAVKGEGLASAAQLLLGGAGSAVGKHSCLLMLHVPATDTYVCVVFIPSVAKSCAGLSSLREYHTLWDVNMSSSSCMCPVCASRLRLGPVPSRTGYQQQDLTS